MDINSFQLVSQPALNKLTECTGPFDAHVTEMQQESDCFRDDLNELHTWNQYLDHFEVKASLY